MPLADPEMELAFAQVRNVRQEFLRHVCIALPVMTQPTCAHKPPSLGECGSPSLSAFCGYTRCVATQGMGPPSSANVTARR
jgi:hypothetical protein